MWAFNDDIAKRVGRFDQLGICGGVVAGPVPARYAPSALAVGLHPGSWSLETFHAVAYAEFPPRSRATKRQLKAWFPYWRWEAWRRHPWEAVRRCREGGVSKQRGKFSYDFRMVPPHSDNPDFNRIVALFAEL